MNLPLAGRAASVCAMARFGQFCPIAVACEVFAERWTPIILRELFAGSHRFNEIHRCIPLISRPLLARRLRELEAAGVIRSTAKQKGKPREYHLTDSGREFRAAVDALGTWGQRWTLRVNPENPLVRAQLAYFLARQDRSSEAAAELTHVGVEDSTAVYVHYYAALAYLEIGNADAAISELKRAVAAGYPRYLVRAAPEFETLEHDSRMIELLQESVPGAPNAMSEQE